MLGIKWLFIMGNMMIICLNGGFGMVRLSHMKPRGRTMGVKLFYHLETELVMNSWFLSKENSSIYYINGFGWDTFHPLCQWTPSHSFGIAIEYCWPMLTHILDPQSSGYPLASFAKKAQPHQMTCLLRVSRQIQTVIPTMWNSWHLYPEIG